MQNKVEQGTRHPEPDRRKDRPARPKAGWACQRGIAKDLCLATRECEDPDRDLVEGSFRSQIRLCHKDGYWVWGEGTGSVAEWDSEGQPVCVCGVQQEIGGRKRAIEELFQSEKRFRSVLENLPNVAVQGYDRDHRVTFWNRASERLYGYSACEAMGQRLEDLIIPDSMREEVSSAVDNWINLGKQIPNAQLLLKHKDGHPVPVFSSHMMLGQSTDEPEMFCIDVDPAEKSAAVSELKQLASYDPLTRLTNRILLYAQLERRLKEADRLDAGLAVFFIDLDNFKVINDGHGHHFGDLALQQVAERLSSSVRAYDTVARFGGDEFVLLIPHADDGDEIASVAARIARLFTSPMNIEGQDIFISASIGVSLFPADGRESKTLLKHADAAMYEAKRSGRNQFRFFTPELNREIERHVALASGLRQAMARNELQLVYQPQVESGSGRIVSCEALLRWHRPGDESGSSDVSIPVAEKFGLMDELTNWVLEQACRDKVAWIGMGANVPRVYLNVSGGPARLRAFYYAFQDALRNHGLQGRDFGIELTENSLVKGSDPIVEILHKLGKAGVLIALDDFGTGHSSLSHLVRFPIDVIKIDRLFLKDAPTNREDGSIVRAIVAMSASLGLKVIAEGVETEEQGRFVAQAGCDMVQGHYFHVPMHAQELSRLFVADDT